MVDLVGFFTQSKKCLLYNTRNNSTQANINSKTQVYQDGGSEMRVDSPSAAMLQGRCDRSPRIAKSPRKPLANPSYANLGVIEALASTDARRFTC